MAAWSAVPWAWLIETERFDDEAYDTVIFGGGVGPLKTTPALIAFARQAMQTSRRIASICTGAFVLAEAGILDGRRATTHWLNARELQARFPAIKVEEDRIFIIDGSVWTSAGASAGIDLALGMVEKDLGADIARLVARQLVVYHRRAGGQSQHSALLEMAPKSDRIQNALAYAKQNLKHRAVGRGSGRGRPSQPPPVQPRLPRRNRAVARQGRRKPAGGSGPRDDGAEPPFDRRGRHRNRLCRSRAHAPRLPARLRPAAPGHPPQRQARIRRMKKGAALYSAAPSPNTVAISRRLSNRTA